MKNISSYSLWLHLIFVFILTIFFDNSGHYSYIQTVRRQNQPGGQVIEVKTQITHRDYINLLTQKDNLHFTIYKRRRCFIHNNQYFQLDLYEQPSHPRCKGLILLETYSALDKEQLLKTLPSFLNIKKEVTGNPDYSMYNLSLREDWTTSKKFCASLIEPENSIHQLKDSRDSTEVLVKSYIYNNGDLNGKAVNGKA